MGVAEVSTAACRKVHSTIVYSGLKCVSYSFIKARLFTVLKWIKAWGRGQTPFALYTLLTAVKVLTTDSIHTPALLKSIWNVQVPSSIRGGKPKSFHTVWSGQSDSSHVILAMRN